MKDINEKCLEQENINNEIKNLISSQAKEKESLENNIYDDINKLKNEIKWQKDSIHEYQEKQETEMIEFKKNCNETMRKTENKVSEIFSKINLINSNISLIVESKKRKEKTEPDNASKTNPNIKPGVSVPNINFSSINSANINDELNSNCRKNQSEYYSPSISRQSTQSKYNQSSYSPINNAQSRESSKFAQRTNERNISNEKNSVEWKSINIKEDDNHLYRNYNEYYSPRLSQQKSEQFSRSAKNIKIVNSPTNSYQNMNKGYIPQNLNSSYHSQRNNSKDEVEQIQFKKSDESKNKNKKMSDSYNKYNEFYSPRLSQQKFDSSLNSKMRPTKSFFNDEKEKVGPNNSHNQITSKYQMNDSDSSNKEDNKSRKIKIFPFENSDDDDDEISSTFRGRQQNSFYPPRYYLNQQKNSSPSVFNFNGSNNNSSESSNSF